VHSESMSLLADNRNLVNQELFSALADPTRRSIIELLATNGQMSATDISDNFDMSNPAISQHLKVLREAELVQMEKSAQKHLYSLNPNTMHSLEDWIQETTRHWDERFEQLDSVLEVEKQKTQKKRR
jgi:DNA-binding transcriptional ArsR family regulator